MTDVADSTDMTAASAARMALRRAVPRLEEIVVVGPPELAIEAIRLLIQIRDTN
jgi:hypothetical protein